MLFTNKDLGPPEVCGLGWSMHLPLRYAIELAPDNNSDAAWVPHSPGKEEGEGSRSSRKPPRGPPGASSSSLCCLSSVFSRCLAGGGKVPWSIRGRERVRALTSLLKIAFLWHSFVGAPPSVALPPAGDHMNVGRSFQLREGLWFSALPWSSGPSKAIEAELLHGADLRGAGQGVSTAQQKSGNSVTWTSLPCSEHLW